MGCLVHWLWRIGLTGYAILSQLVLGYLHFVVAVPYLLLVLLPIPLLAPAVLLNDQDGRLRWSRRLFLIGQVGAASGQMILRALIVDPWLPLRI